MMGFPRLSRHFKEKLDKNFSFSPLSPLPLNNSFFSPLPPSPQQLASSCQSSIQRISKTEFNH